LDDQRPVGGDSVPGVGGVMKANSGRQRNSIRLDGFDYFRSGAYYVTICVRGKKNILGEVASGKTGLSESGVIVAESWLWLEGQHAHVELDEWIVMPNHFHGIIVIHESRRGGSRSALTEHLIRKPLGRIVGAFKTISTKRINQLQNTLGGKFWQRGYYDRIIRHKKELQKIRKYIAENPLKWELDEYHPSRC
jgi:putative transposase